MKNLSKRKAIKRARDRVRLVYFGNQYTIHEWHPSYGDATHISHPMDYWQAREALREDLLCAALEAMGFQSEAFHRAQKEGRWTDLLPSADEVKKMNADYEREQTAMTEWNYNKLLEEEKTRYAWLGWKPGGAS